MAKHNYYPDTLKIQIVERLLKGESSLLFEKNSISQEEELYIIGKNGI